MSLYLLDDTLKLKVFYDRGDCAFEDNLCISIEEACPEDEKLFRADQTNFYLTAAQARQLAQMLLEAADTSDRACIETDPSKQE